MTKQTPIELNEITKKLPKHLHKYVLKQPYTEYTPQNKAVWRYVMRLKVDYLSTVAHPSYLDGSKKTGISLENIPGMEGMNRILKKIGWAAVPGDGLIPAKALVEFYSYNIMVIPTCIKTLINKKYTPILDIIKQSYENTSIIPNIEYSEYLRRFGEISSKAISSPKGVELHENIELLSIKIEDSNESEENIRKYDNKIKSLQDDMEEICEMTQIRNLHWWSVEYGLIGNDEKTKQYGAGLLSLQENETYISENTQKKPYTLEVANTHFNPTKRQKQLFVTPSFTHLNTVLEEFANTMAVRTGGAESVRKLINSKKIGTIELSSGIQVSGLFTNSIKDEKGNLIYVQTEGETALAYAGKELINHGPSYHSSGFGCFVGKLEGFNKSIDKMTLPELETYGIFEGEHVTLNFEGGVSIEGTIIRGMRNIQGDLMLVSFKDCLVTSHDEVIFLPEWGIYDMAIGTKVVSGYPGVADITSFEDIETNVSPIQVECKKNDQELHELYKEVNDMRINNMATDKTISEVFEVLTKKYSNEWLLTLELYELSKDSDFTVLPFILKHLDNLKNNLRYTKLIENGLTLLSK